MSLTPARLVPHSLATLLLSLCLLNMAKGEHIIVIDPGHGGQRIVGKTDGTQGSAGASWNNATAAKYGILEKDLCLQYSIELAHTIVDSPRAKKLGIMAALTRTDDSHVSAMRRAAIAIHHQARIFLSIHFNGSKKHNAEGTRAYYVSEDHPDWEFIHFTNPYVERDRALAQRLVKDVSIALEPYGGDPSKAKISGDAKHDGGHLNDGIRSLGYARQDTHLYQANVVLLEVEFIDNPKVAEWLLNPLTRDGARRAVCKAITKSLCDHIENDSPPEAPLKSRP